MDTNIRLIATEASLLLLTLLLAGNVRRAMKLPLASLLVGAVAYLVNLSSAARALAEYTPLIDLASIITPLWLWLFSRNLFEREPPRWLVWVIIAVYLSNWLVALSYPASQDYTFYLIHGVGLALVADLVRCALTGRDDDLIEKRRTIRLWLPIVIAAQTGGILLVEVIIGMEMNGIGIADYAPLHLINAALFLLLTRSPGWLC